MLAQPVFRKVRQKTYEFEASYIDPVSKKKRKERQGMKKRETGEDGRKSFPHQTL
jgi:hypothetical protein